jgi:hypothetical protein
MTNERKQRWLVRLMLLDFVIACLLGLNVSALTESWTNWNILGFACQAVFLLCVYRSFRNHEELVMRRVLHYFRRIEMFVTRR